MTASFPLSTEPLDMHAEIVKAKHTYGLLYGLSTGLAFALACWAPDAILLYQAHAFYPWLKLLLGAALFMLIGGLAGWLAARLDHGLLAPLLWLAAAGGFAWLTTAIPLQLAPWIVAALEPELANYLDYPLSESFTIRFAVAYAWIGIFSGLVGVMELPLLDQAVFSAASFGKIFPFLVCSIVIAIGGSTTDGLNNEPLRSPILSVDRTIQFAIDTQGQAVDNRLALDMHLGAIHPVQDLLERPRRLVVASFDQQMVQIRVMVNFGGEWVECTTFSNHLSYCKRASS